MWTKKICCSRHHVFRNTIPLQIRWLWPGDRPQLMSHYSSGCCVSPETSTTRRLWTRRRTNHLQPDRLDSEIRRGICGTTTHGGRGGCQYIISDKACVLLNGCVFPLTQERRPHTFPGPILAAADIQRHPVSRWTWLPFPSVVERRRRRRLHCNRALSAPRYRINEMSMEICYFWGV